MVFGDQGDGRRQEEAFGRSEAEPQHQQGREARRGAHGGGDGAPGQDAAEHEARAGAAIGQVAGEGRAQRVTPEEKRAEQAEGNIGDAKLGADGCQHR
jgi:hypothetical protein